MENKNTAHYINLRGEIKVSVKIKIGVGITDFANPVEMYVHGFRGEYVRADNDLGIYGMTRSSHEFLEFNNSLSQLVKKNLNN